MEPIEKSKPSPKLFLLMSVVYFGTFFGLKYGVFKGHQMPWYYNIALILTCLILMLALKNKFKEEQKEV